MTNPVNKEETFPLLNLKGDQPKQSNWNGRNAVLLAANFIGLITLISIFELAFLGIKAAYLGIKNNSAKKECDKNEKDFRELKDYRDPAVDTQKQIVNCNKREQQLQINIELDNTLAKMEKFAKLLAPLGIGYGLTLIQDGTKSENLLKLEVVQQQRKDIIMGQTEL
jgi:hypothetical protein